LLWLKIFDIIFVRMLTSEFKANCQRNSQIREISEKSRTDSERFFPMQVSSVIIVSSFFGVTDANASRLHFKKNSGYLASSSITGVTVPEYCE